MLPAGWLVLGGEASRRDWALSLRDLAPECRLFNHYGPTEATVGMLTCRIQPGLETGPSLTRRSAGRCPIRGLTSSTATSAACPWAPRASCTSAAPAWRAGTSERPRRDGGELHPRSFRGAARRAPLQDRRPGPPPAGRRRSSSWGGSTIRSRSAASASRRGRSRPRCAGTRRCGRRSSPCVRTRRE